MGRGRVRKRDPGLRFSPQFRQVFPQRFKTWSSWALHEASYDESTQLEAPLAMVPVGFAIPCSSSFRSRKGATRCERFCAGFSRKREFGTLCASFTPLKCTHWTSVSTADAERDANAQWRMKTIGGHTFNGVSRPRGQRVQRTSEEKDSSAHSGTPAFRASLVTSQYAKFTIGGMQGGISTCHLS
jgi:hypothetical protein